MTPSFLRGSGVRVPEGVPAVVEDIAGSPFRVGTLGPGARAGACTGW